MPLPTPRPTESKDEFVARCVMDDTMKKEFPNRQQRVAVCFQTYQNRK